MLNNLLSVSASLSLSLPFFVMLAEIASSSFFFLLFLIHCYELKKRLTTANENASLIEKN